MLHASPTKNGTGITIYGDFGELGLLYEFIHHISCSLDEAGKHTKAQHQLLMNFAYEVRKAYSGMRLFKELEYSGDDKRYPNYGFQLVWTDILVFISTLRNCAGYISTNKLQQSILYQLEYAVEEAAATYDAEGAKLISDLLRHQINTSSEYAFIIYQALHIQFVSERPGKTRFRKLPRLVNDLFSPWSNDYKGLISSFRRSAIEQNCDITDLEFSDFPEIKW